MEFILHYNSKQFIICTRTNGRIICNNIINKKASKGQAIAGFILCVLAIVITINSQKALSDGLNEVNANLDKATGARIAEDYVFANDLAAGQSQSFETFTLVTSDKIDKIKNATFKIKEASMY